MMTDFEKIVENLDEAIAYCNTKGVISYANKAFSLLFDGENVLNKEYKKLLGVEKGEIISLKNKNFTVVQKSLETGILVVVKPFDSAQELEQTYCDFISTVSHELRTPLTSIRGFADTMIFSYEKLDSLQIKKFLTIIKEQSNRLIKLIENLLSISKMRSSHENLVYKAVNVKTQIEGLLLMMKNQHKTRSFMFDCPLLLPSVLVDENKFQQILLNLLDNAVKYSEEDTQIKITANETEAGDFVEINVIDSGIGICECDFEKIFQKFTRVESPLTRKAQGSGLGLFIVKNLIEKMGGKITVKSSDSGSIFTLLLPQADYISQSGKKIKEPKQCSQK